VTPYLYGALGAKLALVSVIIHTEHSNLFPEQKKLMIAEKYLSRISNLIIADSEKVSNFLIYHQGISQKKVTTILNGIDIDSYGIIVDRAQKTKELGIDPHDIIIGNVARLVPVKDHYTLLTSFKKVCEAFRDVKLVIAGDGELRSELESFTAKMGLSKNVLFLGSRRDIPELMSIFAARKAIVATNVGGNPEVVQDKVTGLLVPSKNPSALSEALIYLLRNRDERIKMGESGRKRVEQYFSLDTMVKRYENVYQIALNRKRSL
jgi:glycosyltransferase involved in cell wall biosynthesis